MSKDISSKDISRSDHAENLRHLNTSPDEIWQNMFSSPKADHSNLEAMEHGIAKELSLIFDKKILSLDSSEEEVESFVTTLKKFKSGQRALKQARLKAQKHRSKLGELIVGEEGQKDFGPFRLTWKVYLDNVGWELNEISDPQQSWLSGYLKYVGWNRIELSSELSLEEQLKNKQQAMGKSIAPAPPNFEFYVHEWPFLKEALDFLYYDLGRKGAAGTCYEDGFIKHEA